MWEYAAGSFRLVAGLSPSLEALAARLRLDLERGWEDLGWVDVAMFRVKKIDFALSRLEGSPSPDVFVWVSRAQVDVNAALDVLLNALGIGEEALTFRGDVETGFVDLRATPEAWVEDQPVRSAGSLPQGAALNGLAHSSGKAGDGPAVRAIPAD